MTFGIETFILIFAIIVFVGILIGKVGSRFGIPALLLFLFTGMLFGEDGLGIQFENAKLAQDIGMVALSIILFTGGDGYQDEGNTSDTLAGDLPFHAGSSFNDCVYGAIYLRSDKLLISLGRGCIQPSAFLALGSHYVEYRLRIGVCSASLAESAPQRELKTYVGVGER